MAIALHSVGGLVDTAAARTEPFGALPNNAFVVWAVGIENDSTISTGSGFTQMSSQTLGQGTGKTMARLWD